MGRAPSYAPALSQKVRLSCSALDQEPHLRPNEGIQQSVRNALVLWLFFGLFFGLLGGLLGGLFFGLYFGPFVGLFVGLGVALLFDGSAGLQHYTLRFVLWHTGAMRLRYVRFLDEAATRLLLRKAGGGYGFIHRLVLDYFASLGKPPHADPGAKSSE